MSVDIIKKEHLQISLIAYVLIYIYIFIGETSRKDLSTPNMSGKKHTYKTVHILGGLEEIRCRILKKKNHTCYFL